MSDRDMTDMLLAVGALSFVILCGVCSGYVAFRLSRNNEQDLTQLYSHALPTHKNRDSMA